MQPLPQPSFQPNPVANSKLLSAVQSGDVQACKDALVDGADPHTEGQVSVNALQTRCMYDNLRCAVVITHTHSSTPATPP